MALFSLATFVPVDRNFGMQSDPEGTLWDDPPHYWDDIVYPAYLEAHKDVFENGDVENGKPASKVEELLVLESVKMDIGEAFDLCCQKLKEAAGKS